MMKNETFVNGINFIRAVMSGVMSLDGLGLLGGQMVLEHVVDPGLDILRRNATKIKYKEIEIDAFQDLLNDESVVISPLAAQTVISRVRMTNCLIDERDELPKYKTLRIGDQMAAVDVDTGEILENGAPDEENLLAKMAIELDDCWSDVELGETGHQLYMLLLMALEAVENLLERMKGHEFLTGEQADIMNEAFRLEDELHDRIHLLLEHHPDYGNVYGKCNGDCANCDYYQVDGCEEK